MRKPHFLDWAGKKVLALYDGMNDLNKAAILEQKYDEVCLFQGDWEDLSYFSSVWEKIHRLSVVTGGKCDLSGIRNLRKLKRLRLDEGFEPVAPKEILDFSVFNELEECQIFWRKTFSPNLFDCPNLKFLTIWKHPGKDVNEIARAKHLHSLQITQCPVNNLAGIENMPMLHTLRLDYLRNLDDISAIDKAQSLKEVGIGNCPKLTDLSKIYALHGLERFYYSGKVPLADLNFLSSLPSLREFIFTCPVIEQDFTPIFKLKKIELGRFIALRNYNASDEELLELANRFSKKLKLEVIGRGKKEQTVTFEFPT